MTMQDLTSMPFLCIAGCLFLFFLAFAIESLRFHWLSFGELPDEEQKRLLDEAKKHPFTIGSITSYPDPQAFNYYTKIKKRH
jgi:hypothetical protein